MGNDVSRVAVVDVCRGSLVGAQVGARRGTEAILLHLVCPRQMSMIGFLVAVDFFVNILKNQKDQKGS